MYLKLANLIVDGTWMSIWSVVGVSKKLLLTWGLDDDTCADGEILVWYGVLLFDVLR